MIISIIKCENCEEGFTQLFVNDELIFEGDTYHDKIEVFIEGFTEGLSYSNEDYTLINSIKNICKFGCRY